MEPIRDRQPLCVRLAVLSARVSASLTVNICATSNKYPSRTSCSPESWWKPWAPRSSVQGPGKPKTPGRRYGPRYKRCGRHPGGVWPSRMRLPPDSTQSDCWEATVWFLKSSSKRVKCHQKTYIIIMITLSSTVGQTFKKKKNSTATLDVFIWFLSFLRPDAWRARLWASGPWTACLPSSNALP